MGCARPDQAPLGGSAGAAVWTRGRLLNPSNATLPDSQAEK